MTGLEVGWKFSQMEGITAQYRKIHGLSPHLAVSMKRHVVENKDRFLEGAEFTDEWESYMQNEGIEKQRRELYRKRDDYEQSSVPLHGNKPRFSFRFFYR